MEIENDKVVKKDYLELLHISVKVSEEEDNQLFQWIKSLYLDYDDENLEPRIATYAWEFGVNVEWVFFLRSL